MKKLTFAFLLFTCAFMASAQDQREFLYTESDTTYTMKRYVLMMLDNG